MTKDELGNRIKENYENRSKTYLTRRTPVILRLDGKAFHSYTKGLNRPFDDGLIEDMQQTAIYLCSEIQGAKCSYTQSDEISILITDYDKLETDAWFDYSVQKMCSVAASLATSKFNQLRMIRESIDWDNKVTHTHLLEDYLRYFHLANFDCRAFNIPKEEVSNYFLWRQKDAVRNSISMVAQSMYSPKELHGKNSSEQQEMIHEKGQNWNDFEFYKKRGSFIVKNMYMGNRLLIFEPNELILSETEPIRSKWEVVETPLNFTNNDFKNWL